MIAEIARDLGVSRNTVRKVLRLGETSFEYERNTATESWEMDG
jgi:predicted transcriptional regulator